MLEKLDAVKHNVIKQQIVRDTVVHVLIEGGKRETEREKNRGNYK